jgi:spore coat protein JC
MSEREMMLRRLSAMDFAIWELHMYLDTHPEDTLALAKMNEARAKREELVKSYEGKFGPLMSHQTGNNTKWTWLKDPWPWDYKEEACNMWHYEKKLQYPVRIKNPNPAMAKVIISQYGGPDGEIGASLRYLSQRYTMPYAELKGLLTDIGTEEMAHFEMVATIVHQLTRNLTEEEIKKSGFDTYFEDHTVGIYPIAASGVPFSAATFAVKGDVIADLSEDLAAEQKARVTYDNILRLADDPDVKDPIRFLREREVVHFQRFGEGLRIATDRLNEKNFYAFNPAFDR